jgi:hypothetical protein
MGKRNEVDKSMGGIEEAVKGLPVSRRWLLRNTANAAAGAIAVSTLGAGAAKAEVARSAAADEIHVGRPQGYVYSLHGWDTI